MEKYFDNVEQVSNGFIVQVDLANVSLLNYLRNLDYLNLYKINDNFYPLSSQLLLELILENSLNANERESIKYDFENTHIYIFSSNISIIEKVDSIINLIYHSMYNDKLIEPISNQLYTSEDINALFVEDYDIYYEGERLGQLDLIDFAKYSIDNNDYINAVKAYYKYFKKTGDLAVGFNLATVLTTIGAYELGLSIYKNISSKGFECNHNIALCYYKLGKYNIALKYIKEVDFENSPKSYLLMASIYIQLRQYLSAIKVINNGFIRLKLTRPIEAKLLKEQFITLNTYLKKNDIKID